MSNKTNADFYSILKPNSKIAIAIKKIIIRQGYYENIIMAFLKNLKLLT